MRRTASWRPSHATVVAYLALFVALGGSGYAATRLDTQRSGTATVAKKKPKAKQIDGSTIKKGSIPGDRLKARSVTGAQINASTLGTVPTATTATSAGHAGSADSATHAGSADSATSAGHASSADSATSAQPSAFALVDGTGTVSKAKGVSNSNVAHPAVGIYCISGLAFAILGGQVTTLYAGSSGTTGMFQPGTTGFCPKGGQVLIYARDGITQVDQPFNLVLYG